MPGNDTNLALQTFLYGGHPSHFIHIIIYKSAIRGLPVASPQT